MSPTNLDGTPNPYLEEKKKVYAKRFESKMIAALYGKIEAAYPKYKVYLRDTPTNDEGRRKANPLPEEVRKYYAFYDYGEPLRHLRYLVAVCEIDGCFLKHFVHVLQDADEFEDYLEHEQRELQQRQTDLEQIERDINATKAAMRRIEEQAENGELTNAALARKANESHSLLEQELARLEGRKVMIHSTTTRAERRVGYKELMKRAGDRWSEVVQPEDLPEMIDTFVEKVVWAILSPHFYTLTVHWRDPEWGVDELPCFRELHPTIQWTKEEDAILQERYPTATADELITLFPERTPLGIRKRARRLGIACEVVKDWEGYRSDPARWTARWENRWTKEEDAILVEKYPTGTADELLQLLPGRTPRSMSNRAIRLHLKSEVTKNWRTFRRNCEGILTPADREVMEKYGITEEELRISDVKLLRCSKVPSRTEVHYISPQL